MSKNLTPFFATEKDLSQLLKHVVAARSLQFVAGGLFDSPTLQSMPFLSKPDPTTNYLVAERDLTIEVRAIIQKSGGQKFAVDQLANPKTIAIRPGGLIDEHCLIAGQVGTASDDQTARNLFKLFTSEMRKRFFKIKSYYVGEEAAQLLDNGVRLTTNPKSQVLYDLTRS